MESSGFIVKRTAGNGCFLINSLYDSPFLREVLQSLDLYLNKSDICKDSRTTKAGFVELGPTGNIFIKRYNNKGFSYTVRYLMRQSRAFRAFRSHLLFRKLDIPVPEPVAAVESRSFGIALNASWLLVKHIGDTVPVLEFYEILRKDEQIEEHFISSVCNMLAKLHAANVTHGDMKLSNIFVKRENTGAHSFGLWDLDAAVMRKFRLSDGQRAAELGRFIASFIDIGKRLNKEPERNVVTERILAGYEKFSGTTIDKALLNRFTGKFL